MSKRLLLVAVLSSCAFLLPAAYAQVKPVISGPVDDSARVVLTGSRHPLAQPQWDAGAVDPGLKMDRMLLVLGPSAEQESQLQAFLDSQHDKASANYHHWLTPEEFAQKFGPATQDIEAVQGWLTQQGFTVTSIARSGRWIEFAGVAGQVEGAFGTKLRHYAVGQSKHIANATDISLPAALAPVVRGVVSLHDFFKKPMLTRYLQARPNGDGTYSPITPDATFNTPNGPLHALTPGDYTKIYNLAPLYATTPIPLDGRGTSIAIVARSDVNTTDIAQFRQITGLPPGSVANTLTLPPDPGFDTVTGDGVEATLDAEWAGAVAPGALIGVVVSANTATSDGVDLSAAYIVDHNLSAVMSVSFGECEANLGPAINAFYNSLWQQAAAQGISVMVASGDSGAAGCDFVVQPVAARGGLAVSGLSSTPFNTAVGGTQFADVGNDALYWAATNTTAGVSVNGYIPEVGWNESCDPTAPGSPCASTGFVLASGGGGASKLYSKPVWQSGLAGIPNDLARDVPDLSLTAASHDGYVICFNNSCGSGFVGIVGGTSASSPSFAGMMTIVVQAMQGTRQGLANYNLYQLAQRTSALCNSAARTNPAVPAPASCIFNDVTFGSNSVPGQAGFSAGPVYDQATGLGSVNAANLVNAWKTISLQTTTIAISSNGGTTISAAHGQPVPLAVNVTGALASPAPGGNVALASSNLGPAGAVAVIGPANSNVGSFNGSVSNLPGGIYTLTAHYSGDAQFAPSDSNSISVNIAPETSATTLHTFALSTTGFPVPTTSFPYGSFMDLQANVAGASGQGIPSGNVSFQDTTTPAFIGSAGLNLKGESELFLLGGNNFPFPLTLGTHTITAGYSGDSSFASGTSAPVTLTITKGNPNVSIAPVNNFVATQPDRLDAFVNPTGQILPTGSVQFFDGGVPLGAAAPIQPGSTQALIQATFATEGQHSITASYAGDSTYNPAVSPVFAVNVVAPFTFFATTTSATIKAGQTATFNMNIGGSNSPSTFTGTVALSCSSASAGVTCAVNPTSFAITQPANGGPITVTVSTTTSASLHDGPFRRLPWVFAGIVAVALCGFGRRGKYPLAMIVLLVLISGAAISCGGGGTPQQILPPPPPPPTQASVIVTGTSGTHTNSITLNVTITH